MTKKAMRIIGVTGGVGAGKSTVLSILQKEYGARIIEMDAVGKELMEPGTSCFEEICRAFGKRILLPEGGLDRKKLAETVFRDEAALERLSAALRLHALAEPVDFTSLPLLRLIRSFHRSILHFTKPDPFAARRVSAQTEHNGSRTAHMCAPQSRAAQSGSK